MSIDIKRARWLVFVAVLPLVVIGSIPIFFAIVAARFLDMRVYERVEFLDSLVTMGQERLDLQVFPAKGWKKVAKKVGSNLATIKEERTAFDRTNKNPMSSKPVNFVTPDNVYEEASSRDPQYKTAYGNPMTSDDVFLHKKPIVVPSPKDKNK